MFYIYEHRRLDNNQLFYIGKGKDQRAYSTKDRSPEWHKVCLEAGGRKVEIVFQCEDETVTLAFEKTQIKIAVIWGEKLVNKTHGGEGKSGVRRTEAQKEHLRQINLGKKHKTSTKLRLSKRFENKVWAHNHLQASLLKCSTLEAKALHQEKQKLQYKPVIGINIKTKEQVRLDFLSQDKRFDPSLIAKCCNNQRKSHAGYSWQWAIK